MAKRALITGILGQDGSYLAELLLSKDYAVYGMVRRSSVPHYDNIAGIHDRVHLLYGDLIDMASLVQVLEESRPDEVYNLAAQSHVGLSFTHAQLTAQVNGLGPLRLLEAIRLVGLRSARFYQASTSELFGNDPGPSQHEETPMHPVSPYANAKLYAHHTVRLARDMGMFACSGILFNHESPRRSLDFVTRKIAHGVARIAHGLQDSLELGNLTARRDWGYAPDYVEAMWLMLQSEQPRDYVIATGESHSVEEFAQLAFINAGISASKRMIVCDQQVLRPTDVHCLRGDALVAYQELEWKPRVGFEELVCLMVEHELMQLSEGK